MPKKIQDIKSNKANIITILHDQREEIRPERAPQISRRMQRAPRAPRPKKPKTLFFVLASVLVIAAGYWGLVFFEHAKVAIVERTDRLTLAQDEFTASKNAGPVHFEIMIISDTGYKDMLLTHAEEVSLKASGEAIFYNEYTPTPQKLVTATRLSDETGKSYTTDAAITIPGYTLDKDKKIIPGAVTVGIHAFLPGDVYNAMPEDLKIVLFKGTPKYNKIYAKAAIPVSGGAQGLAYMLDSEQKGALTAFASSTFKNNLLKKIAAQVPEGYILYNDAFSFANMTKTDALYPTPNAKVEVAGTLSAVILRRSDLSQALVRRFIPDAKEASDITQIELSELDTLSFSFRDSGQTVQKDLESLSFTLTGESTALWHSDTEKIQKSLAGIPRVMASSIFNQDKGVKSATVKIFPPWQGHLPFDAKKIKIDI
ncbi:MAG: hypothetical protein V4665_00695 [Patescibacteria group bacterium]